MTTQDRSGEDRRETGGKKFDGDKIRMDLLPPEIFDLDNSTANVDGVIHHLIEWWQGQNHCLRTAFCWLGEAMGDDGPYDDSECGPGPTLMHWIAKVMTFGAKKYGDRNWEAGMNWSRLYGAAMRHLNAHRQGDETDPETGYPHLAHAGCCIAFLLTYQARGIGTDDRPKT